MSASVSDPPRAHTHTRARLKRNGRKAECMRMQSHGVPQLRFISHDSNLIRLPGAIKLINVEITLYQQRIVLGVHFCCQVPL